MVVKKMKELKRCPFCGGENVGMVMGQFFEELMTAHGSAVVSVGCDDCDLEMYLYTRDFPKDERSFNNMMARAIESWNRRA